MGFFIGIFMASAYLTIWTELSNYEDLFNEHLKIVNYIQEWLYDESLAISNAEQRLDNYNREA